MIFKIFIKSNNHPRTINTPQMGRTNYDLVVVEGKEALIKKFNELKAQNINFYEIRSNTGSWYWVKNNLVVKI